MKPKPLVIIPNYVTKPEDVDTLFDAIKSVRKTVSDSVDILIVDDKSPLDKLVHDIESKKSDFGFDFHRKKENSGFSKTVNVGLRRALTEGRDAVLMNADLEIETPGWVKLCRQTTDEYGNPAGVVGALLLYPTSGLIQHGGIYFSLLTRNFDHMFKFGPMNLPEAHKKKAVPVTGAFQFIRHECLTAVGLYDEAFHMGYEDVDYCVRVFLSGRQCVYQPKVRGWHHEMMFRGRPGDKLEKWHNESLQYLAEKYRDQSFADFVPYW